MLTLSILAGIALLIFAVDTLRLLSRIFEVTEANESGEQ